MAQQDFVSFKPMRQLLNLPLFDQPVHTSTAFVEQFDDLKFYPICVSQLIWKWPFRFDYFSPSRKINNIISQNSALVHDLSEYSVNFFV